MKKIFTCILAAMLAMPLFAERILTENFDYNLGGLKEQGGWVAKGTQTGNPIQVVNSPLTYLGYMDKAVGYAAQIEDKTTSDEDLYKLFPNSKKVESGTVYMSALFKVTKNIVTENPTYFLAMTKGTTGEYCKLFVLKGSSESTYKIGITKTVTTANKVAYYSQELTVGTTYLCVLGYTWVDGTTNDIASLWINPTNFTTQPTANAQESYSSDANQLDGFELQQRCTYNSTCPVVTVDGIRVATTWADLFTNEEEEEEDKDPELSVSKSTLDFKDFTAGETPNLTFTVIGANLTEDVTISTTSEAFTVSPTNISKDNVGTPQTVTVTLSTEQSTDFSNQEITISSGELSKTVTVKGNVYVPELVEISNFAVLLNQEDTEGKIYNYTGTAAKILGVDSELKQIILKDILKSVKVQISDADWAANTYVEGMKVTQFVFTAEILLGGTSAICTPITLTFAAPNFTREITSTDLATICLKGDVSNFAKLQEQATFYKILCKQEYQGEVYNIVLEEVNTNMDAGKPYIFQPKAPCTMEFYYSATTDFAGSENGLIGTFTKIESAVDNVLVGKYLIANNMICKAGEYCSLAANRAYIDIDQVPAEENAAPKVGMRHINLQNADARQLPTNLNETQTHNSVRKAIINGQFVILHNNKAFNAIGAEIQ